MDGPFHFHAAKLHRFLQTIDCKLYKHLAFFKKYIANCTEALQIIQKKNERKKMPIKSAFFISYVWYDNIHYRKENQMQEPQIPSFHQDDQLHIARNMLIADH